MKARQNYLLRLLPRGIRGRLLLLIGIVLSPVLLLNLWDSYERYRDRRAEQFDNESEAARTIAIGFETFVKDVRRHEQAIGRSLAASAGTGRLDVDECNRELALAARDYVSIWRLAWLDGEGRVVCSDDERGLGISARDEPYYAQAISQDWSISDLLFSPETGKPYFVITKRVLGPKNKLVGVVVASLAPERVTSDAPILRRAGAGVAFAIFDSRGTLVYRYPKEPVKWTDRVNWRQSDRILDEALRQNTARVGITYFPVNTEAWLSARLPIAGMAWFAGAAREERTAMAPAVNGFIRDALGLLFVYSLALLAALTISRSIGAPLRRLRSDSCQIGRGEEVSAHDPRAPYEINELRRALIDDMLERKRAEQALRVSEEKFRHLFENMSEAVAIDEMIYDEECRPVDWRVVDVNAAYERIFGIPRERARGKRASELYGAAIDVPGILNVYSAVVISAKPSAIEVNFTPTGRYLLISVFPMGGNYFATASTDITARKKADLEREKLLGELDATVTSIADGLLVFNRHGRLTRMNHGAQQMLEAAFDEVKGEPETLLQRLDLRYADGREMSIEHMPSARALRGEVLHNEPMVVRGRDARTIWLSVSAGPLRDKEGRVSGAVVTFSDFTALHDLQEQQRELLYLVSHDLRAPITTIDAHAHLVQRAVEARDNCGGLGASVEAIRGSSRRLNAMIGELVDAAAIEGGQMQLDRQPRQLSEIISGLLGRMASVWHVNRIHVMLPVALPAVYADGYRLERVLTNLLSNALKYSPPESIVTLKAWASDTDVTIAVEDRGAGIAPDEIPKLFGRFYRTSRGKTAEGIGLGLYITRKIVEAHGGRIWVESEVGKGSVFLCSFPRAVPALKAG